MQTIKQALLDTEDQICNLLDILDEDGTLGEYEHQLDFISSEFDNWVVALNDELFYRETTLNKKVDEHIGKMVGKI
jgi:hypothetical protein